MKIYRTLLRQARAVLEERIDYYSQFNPSPLSVKQFTDFGRTASNEESFSFLRRELPVRLANIMKEFRLLPEYLTDMPSLVNVKDLYRQSFEDLLNYEKSIDDMAGFTEDLIRIRNRHRDVVMQTAAGVMELKEAQLVNANIEANIQYFLDRFYMSRISIRMLINQHTLLFGPEETNGNHIGCIDPACNIMRVVEDAYSNARYLCDQYYLACPELQLLQHEVDQRTTQACTDVAAAAAGGAPLTVAYVPSHLYHMLFELFKNAMRAVVEHHSPDGDLPPLQVLLVKGKEDLCIKLSDQGGGIPRSHMDLLFNYMYSTAPQVSTGPADMNPPLAGYGYGLPLSRLYARYFQGDLTLNSIEGFGTDALIYLKAMSSEANELLPVYNKTCQRQYNTPQQTNDWSSQLHSSMFIRPFSTNTLNRMTNSSSKALWKHLLRNATNVPNTVNCHNSNSNGSNSSSSSSSTGLSTRDVHYAAGGTAMRNM